jgi:tetratricopeptide (TPR) repeat protein
MARETVDSLCLKAQQAVAQGKNEQARQFFQQALGLVSDNPDVHYGMATVCFLLNDLPSSAYHFKEVTRLDPQRAGAYINLGAVYNRLEQYDDAIPFLRRGIQLDMNRAEGYYNLGLVYRRKGQMDMAIQAYREAVRVNPRMADAHFNIANIYLENSQFRSAMAHYRQALEIRPNWEKAYRGLKQTEQSMAEQGEYEAESTQQEPKKHAEPSALDPQRMVDADHHGNELRAVHQYSIEMQEQGMKFLALLEEEVEPAIKELSILLLNAAGSPLTVEHCLVKFDAAVTKFLTIQEDLQDRAQKVREAGERLVRS